MTTRRQNPTSTRAKSLYDDVSAEFDIAQEVAREVPMSWISTDGGQSFTGPSSDTQSAPFVAQSHATLHAQAAYALNQGAGQILGQALQSVQQQNQRLAERLQQYYATTGIVRGATSMPMGSNTGSDEVIDINTYNVTTQDHLDG